jgi:sugar phosphate isomerase/epimerase
MLQDMKNAGIECAGLHWLLTPPPEGLHFTSPDNEVRIKTIEYLDELIDFCGDLGGKILVFGSPGQRGTSQGISIHEAKKFLADGLSKVADHAKERDVQILLEPLPKKETDVVNTLEEAITMVEKINHPSISSMFDFHNTLDETESLPDLIRKYYRYIHHVHVQNMDGSLIRSDNIPEDFIPVFKTLKDLSFDKWISTEVFDFSPGGKFITQESMKTYQKIEKMIR